MKKFIKKIKSNKPLAILSVLILGVFIVLIARITYAFLAPIINDAKANIVVKGDTVDEFKLSVGDPIKMDATPTTLKEDGTNYVASTTATASLKANSTKNKATYGYYLYFKLENNTFKYSDGSTPEIILTITNPNGEEVTSIDGLTYGTFSGVSGFDVTTQNGLFNIANNYQITSNSSTTTTKHDWKITLTYLNLPVDQSSNYGNSMEVSVLLQKEEIIQTAISKTCKNGQNLSECIIATNSIDDSLYYHDASLTNGAGDNSYRYAGANPNNYVCFGTNTTPCPTDNLYRIIGVFGDKVKLIKYDYATSALLGTNGDYYSSTTPDSSDYKGSLTSINEYYWNYKATYAATNTWSTGLLNKTNLNTNFITNIGTGWANKIAMTTWKVGGNTYANIYSKTPSVAYQNEIVNPATTNTTDNATEYTAKIGLMYVSDYGFAAEPSAWTLTMGTYNNTTATSTNWMYMGLYEWTISRLAGDSKLAFIVNGAGNVHFSNANSWYGVRPSFNLESSVTYVSGSGSADDPMVIN